MKRISFDKMLQEFARILLSAGFEISNAEKCAQIFTENTCDGVISHGLYSFPGFVSNIKNGLIKLQVEPELISSLGMLEQWDGKRGAGPLNAEVAMNRAVELSRGNGIACVGLRNTNHWMRAGTYGLLAAEAGCIGICWTNTIALMPPWGSARKKIGNNPLVVCVPRDNGPVLLDMAISQFSNGKLATFQRLGKELPLAGGYDENGELTTDPGAILKSERALPIGHWKGSGLALVLDLMASLISGGDSTMDISQRENETGVSQVFIAIDILSQTGAADMNEKVDAIIEDFLNIHSIDKADKVRYPGHGMLSTRKENIEKGIPVDTEFWQKILEM